MLFALQECGQSKAQNQEITMKMVPEPLTENKRLFLSNAIGTISKINSFSSTKNQDLCREKFSSYQVLLRKFVLNNFKKFSL